MSISVNRWKALSFLILIICCSAVLITPLNYISKSFLVLSILNFVFFSSFFRNIYNPASVFGSLFIFMIGCSQARLTEIEQDPWDIHTWYCIISVLVVFYSIMLFYIFRFGRMKPNIPLARKYRVNGNTLLISNLLCLAVEIIIYFVAFNKIGTIPIFDDNARANIMPAVISNYMMTLMVIPAFFIIFNTVYVAKSKKYYFLIFSAIFIVMLTSLGGRINVFIPVITSLFYLLIQYVFDRGNIRNVLLTGLITLVVTAMVMVSIPLIRTSIYSGSGSDYYSEIYKNKTDVKIPSNTLVGSDDKNYIASNKKHEDFIPGSGEFKPSIKIPARILPVWINFSTEMHAFNKLVIYFNYTQDWRGGSELLTGTFNFIGKHFYQKEQLDLDKMGGYNWINIMTFMQKPYMDFGVYGVIGFMIFFTVLGMSLYVRVQRKHTFMNTLFYSYFCMTMLFMVFDNHYYYSTALVNYILLLLFKVFMQTDWIKGFHKFKQLSSN
ncbi:Protein of uncharacterised function DUF70 [Escherichia coli]|nr:hypothetical protein AUP83_23460 [Escherichia coli]SQU14361.1 Protein of uncharacterised function DUF70 [Escherichia coli]